MDLVRWVRPSSPIKQPPILDMANLLMLSELRLGISDFDNVLVPLLPNLL